MTTTTQRPSGKKAVSPPSKLLMALEFTRAPLELAAGLAALPYVSALPRGDGHAVIVIPGLAADDLSTGLLRSVLRQRGYEVHAWGQGPNLGPRPGVLERLVSLLESVQARSGRKVSLVGWSLGGVFARYLASIRPELVRQVITLGSPIQGMPKATNAWRLYELASGRKTTDDPDIMDRLHSPPQVPSTSVYSRTDGIVAWQASVDFPTDHTESIEVGASHIGMGVHPQVLYIVADRLAQAEGQWRPYQRPQLPAALRRRGTPAMA